MKIKRNYQFVQFLLDLFGLFLLYLLISAIIDDIGEILYTYQRIIRDEAHAEQLMELVGNPYPVIIWAVIAVLIYVAGIILPLLFKLRTKLNQTQYNMWVYATLLIRILVMITLIEITGKHLSFIHPLREPESLFSFQILATILLIAILIRFTQIRIRAAELKNEEQEKKREIIED